MGSMLIYVDINGPQKPNTISKDIFVMNLRGDNSTFEMYGSRFSVNHLMTVGIWACPNKGSSLNNSAYCGALIQKHGWKIPDDYPWF